MKTAIKFKDFSAFPFSPSPDVPSAPTSNSIIPIPKGEIVANFRLTFEKFPNF
jgi:hypothetical protein